MLRNTRRLEFRLQDEFTWKSDRKVKEHKCQEEPLRTTVESGFAPIAGLWFRCRFWYHCLLLCSATLRVAGSLQKSTEVMQAMQSLVHVPEVAATMRDLSKEMMKVSHNIASDGYNKWTILVWQLCSCYFRIMLGLLQGVQCSSSCGLFQLERQPFDLVVHTYVFRYAYVCVYCLITFHKINWF